MTRGANEIEKKPIVFLEHKLNLACLVFQSTVTGMSRNLIKVFTNQDILVISFLGLSVHDMSLLYTVNCSRIYRRSNTYTDNCISLE